MADKPLRLGLLAASIPIAGWMLRDAGHFKPEWRCPDRSGTEHFRPRWKNSDACGTAMIDRAILTRLAAGADPREGEDLLNEAAVVSLRSGGRAYALPKARIPRGAPAAATLRF